LNSNSSNCLNSTYFKQLSNSLPDLSRTVFRETFRTFFRATFEQFTGP
jgi:hypothetical protein